MEKKKALRKQFGNILAGHATAIVAETFLQLFLLGFLFMYDATRIAGGVLFVIVYMLLIYYKAKKAAEADKKTYSVLKPSLKKGALFGGMLTVISLLLFAADKCLWTFAAADGELIGAAAKAFNMFFVLWIIPYYGFMGSGAGVVTAAVIILMTIIPIISSFLGYYAGYKGINITEKLNLSMYEKK